MEQNPRKLDPLAVVVVGAAALVALVLVVWLVLSLRSALPKPAPEGAGSVVEGVRSALEQARHFLRKFDERSLPPPAPVAKPAPPRPAAPGQPGGGSAKPGIDLPLGKSWTYNVTLEPEVWRDATLAYRSVADGDAVAVQAEFRHSKGNMAFRLGTYTRGHPSHAQIRFPGFFMHGAYLDFPLTRGKAFSWSYPWQMADNRLREGRVRRWDAVVVGNETVSVPAGRFEAIRIDATVRYIDAGKDLATVNEILWYAPSIRQIVKVARAGRSPDEAGQRIVAELAAMK